MLLYIFQENDKLLQVHLSYLTSLDSSVIALGVRVHIVCLLDEFFYFPDLGEHDRPYLSPLLCLETSKKSVVVGGWLVGVS